jgi:hypothetical protein
MPRMDFQLEHAIHLRSNAFAMQNLNLLPAAGALRATPLDYTAIAPAPTLR